MLLKRLTKGASVALLLFSLAGLAACEGVSINGGQGIVNAGPGENQDDGGGQVTKKCDDPTLTPPDCKKTGGNDQDGQDSTPQDTRREECRGIPLCEAEVEGCIAKFGCSNTREFFCKRSASAASSTKCERACSDLHPCEEKYGCQGLTTKDTADGNSPVGGTTGICVKNECTGPFDTACGVGKKCVQDNTEGVKSSGPFKCMREGTIAPLSGGKCDTSADCSGNSQCFNSICVPMCREEDDCAGNPRGLNKCFGPDGGYPIFAPGVGLCVDFDVCNPSENGGKCTTGSKKGWCRKYTETTGRCFEIGEGKEEGKEGEFCKPADPSSTDEAEFNDAITSGAAKICGEGLSCVSITPGSVPVCMKTCSASTVGGSSACNPPENGSCTAKEISENKCVRPAERTCVATPERRDTTKFDDGVCVLTCEAENLTKSINDLYPVENKQKLVVPFNEENKKRGAALRAVAGMAASPFDGRHERVINPPGYVIGFDNDSNTENRQYAAFTCSTYGDFGPIFLPELRRIKLLPDKKSFKKFEVGDSCSSNSECGASQYCQLVGLGENGLNKDFGVCTPLCLLDKDSATNSSFYELFNKKLGGNTGSYGDLDTCIPHGPFVDQKIGASVQSCSTDGSSPKPCKSAGGVLNSCLGITQTGSNYCVASGNLSEGVQCKDLNLGSGTAYPVDCKPNLVCQSIYDKQPVPGLLREVFDKADEKFPGDSKRQRDSRERYITNEIIGSAESGTCEATCDPYQYDPTDPNPQGCQPVSLDGKEYETRCSISLITSRFSVKNAATLGTCIATVPNVGNGGDGEQPPQYDLHKADDCEVDGAPCRGGTMCMGIAPKVKKCVQICNPNLENPGCGQNEDNENIECIVGLNGLPPNTNYGFCRDF